MIKITRINGGRAVALAVCEVTAIPNYKLLHKDLDHALHANQVLFSQILSGFFRSAPANQASVEILWQSVPVENQTYLAQVRQYLLLRQMGVSALELQNAMAELQQSISNALEGKSFQLHFLDSEDEWSSFQQRLGTVDSSAVLAVGKKERYIQNILMPNSCIYYNDVIQPSVDLNNAELTNALTQHPNSAISLQLIPTAYSTEELIGIEQCHTYMSHYISNLRFHQGVQPDSNIQAVADAYAYLLASEKEPLYYLNLLVYGQPNSARSLANKVIDAVEEEGSVAGSALETADLTGYGITPAKQLPIQPWAISNILIFQQRDQNFWGRSMAPRQMLRMKYLITAREATGIFKLPIDDGTTIGLECRKISANREKFNQEIIQEGNFKLGWIQNASRNAAGQPAQAGIPLNDFTKHSLIVGMPGSGKTNFSLGLLLQFWQDFGIPFLAVEPTKSEYRSLLDAIPELQVFTPGKNQVSPYIVNPFLPPPGVTVEGYIPSLMSAFKAAFSMPNPLPDLFLAAVNECYNLYGWRLSSTREDPQAQPFGLYEFVRVFRRRIQNIDYRGDVRSNMESAGVVRLVSLLEQNPNIYDTIHSIPLEDLLRRPTVIELNAINNKEQKSLIMALLLIQICVYTKNNVAGDGKLKNILMIDEAHVLLGGRSTPAEEGAADAKGSTVEALEDMIAEIRSYGTGIILADQSPTRVGRSILANTNVKVVFKLVEKENRDAISSATNMDEADYDRLGQLGVGEAMVHYGRVYEPLHIKTWNVQDKARLRPVISDQEIAAKTHYWESHQDLLVPYRECAFSHTCSGCCDLGLRTEADFIATRLVNQLLYDLPDKKAFVQMLVKLDPLISAKVRENPSLSDTARLHNCVKIRFLRKSMLARNLGIKHSEYEVILRHPKFLTAPSSR